MASSSKSSEFYIGYLPHAPATIAARMRWFIFSALATSVLAALLFILGQQPFAASAFEFLQPRTFAGTISMEPYPALLVMRPGKDGNLPALSRYYLVAEGKHGAQAEVANYAGQRVQLQGKLIYREDQTMLELVPNSIAPLAEAQAAGSPHRLGTFTLSGEIVDSKCFLGVMNPGAMKTHRACAVRCIAGGIPPLFVTRDANGSRTYLMLLSATGRAVNEQVLNVVAQPLTITGDVWQYDNRLALRADPATYRAVKNVAED